MTLTKPTQKLARWLKELQYRRLEAEIFYLREEIESLHLELNHLIQRKHDLDFLNSRRAEA